MLFLLVKMALKSIKSVETAIIIGMGFHTPPHPKSLEMHFQNTTKDIFQTTTNKLLTPVQLQGQSQWTRWMNYVQQDFSSASLMAMPANLSSFCLASTYHTLPSPTKLKKWRITTEAMCTLCSKYVCSTAHILGACSVSLQQTRYRFDHDTVLCKITEALNTFILNIKEGACRVSLQQGRYRFKHDTVLRKVIEALNTFILNIKEAVRICTKSSITFVKKGAKVPHKRTPPVGILHHASDWILLADLNSNYCFPVHMAFIQLRPDITIFSNSFKYGYSR